MSRVFMVFAASGENLFKARCGAKDFFDSLHRPRRVPGGGGFIFVFQLLKFRVCIRSFRKIILFFSVCIPISLFFFGVIFFGSHFFEILYRKNQPFFHVLVHYLQKSSFLLCKKTLCNLYKLPVSALCTLVAHGKSSCYDKCVPSQRDFGRNSSARKFI